MNNIDVDKLLNECRQELDHVQSCIATLGIMSPVSPYLTKYAVIKACGTIEVSFKSLIADFCNKRSKKQVQQFINWRIVKGSANPSHDNIRRLLGQFDENWKKAFQNNINTDPDKTHMIASLESLVAARNEFSHGGNPTISITDVSNHFDYARRVVQYIDGVVI
ncbi:MAG TPA: hypothetical protein DIS96_06530 [Pusillimonas sp.]|nr:hypothetical protein [Pusillimonas sp.]|tara:strand:- start:341 stop:832 length:492 start_codon:yes stop_codon:yes gene_type:complete